ncbi:hypothetical protein COY07_03035 [Candidatus Peregrinibacteria bacterium CG_4_10_14_0_2_um_filter_43_11]|nr:MAG: hypothetical protein COY07_03035 [Candidatus Peregrinibacteria bacterium CG_4_10_14_0_2_um_filter_43_11]
MAPKKPLVIIGMIGISFFFLGGCSTNQKTSTALLSPETETIDHLKEARQELFSEIGIKEEDEKMEETDNNELPVVLPTPPELPKTDADL